MAGTIDYSNIFENSDEAQYIIDDFFLKGGLHVCDFFDASHQVTGSSTVTRVTTVQGMPLPKKKVGMIAYAKDTKAYYQLKTINSWEEISIGSGSARKTWPAAQSALDADYFSRGDIVLTGGDAFYCNTNYPAVALVAGASGSPEFPPSPQFTNISTAGSVKSWVDGAIYTKGDLVVLNGETYMWTGKTTFTVPTTTPPTKDIPVASLGSNKFVRIANATSVKVWPATTVLLNSSAYSFNKGDIVIVDGESYICNASFYPNNSTTGTNYPAKPTTGVNGWTKIGSSSSATVKTWPTTGTITANTFTRGDMVVINGTTYYCNSAVYPASDILQANLPATPPLADWKKIAFANSSTVRTWPDQATALASATAANKIAVDSFNRGDMVLVEGDTYYCNDLTWPAIEFTVFGTTGANSGAVPPYPSWRKISNYGQAKAWPTTATIQPGHFTRGDIVKVNEDTYMLTAVKWPTGTAAINTPIVPPSNAWYNIARASVVKQWPDSSISIDSFTKGDIVVVDGDTYSCTVNAWPSVLLTGTTGPNAYPAVPPSNAWARIASSGKVKTWPKAGDPAITAGTYGKADLVVVDSDTYYCNVTSWPATGSTHSVTTSALTPPSPAWKKVANSSTLKTWLTGAVPVESFVKGDMVKYDGDTYVCKKAYPVSAPAGATTVNVPVGTAPDSAFWDKLASSGYYKQWVTNVNMPAKKYSRGDLVVVDNDTYFLNSEYYPTTELAQAAVPSTPPPANWKKIANAGSVKSWVTNATMAADKYSYGDLVVVDGDTYSCTVSSYPTAAIVAANIPTVPPKAQWKRIASSGTVKSWPAPAKAAVGTTPAVAATLLSSAAYSYSKGDMVVVDGDTYVCIDAQYPLDNATGTYPVVPPVASWKRIASSGTVKSWPDSGAIAASTYGKGDIVVIEGDTYICTRSTWPTTDSPYTVSTTVTATAGPLPPSPDWKKLSNTASVVDFKLTNGKLLKGSFTKGDICVHDGDTYTAKKSYPDADLSTLPGYPPKTHFIKTASSGTYKNWTPMASGAELGLYSRGDLVVLNSTGDTYFLTDDYFPKAVGNATTGTIPATPPSPAWRKIANAGIVKPWPAVGVSMDPGMFSRGDIVTIDGDSYSCTAAHYPSGTVPVVRTASMDIPPTSSWKRIASSGTYKNWRANQATNTGFYTKGDLVTYLGDTYFCMVDSYPVGTTETVTLPNTAPPTEELVAYGNKAPWKKLVNSGTVRPWRYNATTPVDVPGKFYLRGDLVKVDGDTYSCIVDAYPDNNIATNKLPERPPVVAGTSAVVPAVVAWSKIASSGSFKTWPASGTIGIGDFGRGDIVKVGTTTYFCNAESWPTATFTIKTPSNAETTAGTAGLTPPLGIRLWRILAEETLPQNTVKEWPTAVTAGVFIAKETYTRGDIVIVDGDGYYCNALKYPATNLTTVVTLPPSPDWKRISNASKLSAWSAGAQLTVRQFTRGDLVTFDGDTYMLTIGGFPSAAGPAAATPPSPAWKKIASSGKFKTWPTTGTIAVGSYSKGDIVKVDNVTYFMNADSWPSAVFTISTTVAANSGPIPPTSQNTWRILAENAVTSAKEWAVGAVYNQGDLAIVGSDTYLWKGDSAYTVTNLLPTAPDSTVLGANKFIKVSKGPSVDTWPATNTTGSGTITKKFYKGDIAVVESGEYAGSYVCTTSSVYPAKLEAGIYPANPVSSTVFKKISGSLTAGGAPLGAWASVPAGTGFKVGDIVTVAGSGTEPDKSYVCKTAHVKSATFAAGITNWLLLAASGAKGADGTNGTTLRHRGEFAASPKIGAVATGYSKGDIVTVGSSSFMWVADAASGTSGLVMPGTVADQANSNWKRVGRGIKVVAAAWVPGTYNYGDLVTYGNATYICISEAGLTSATTGLPSTDVANWKLVASGISVKGTWAAIGGDYFVGDIVYHTATKASYICIQKHAKASNATLIPGVTGSTYWAMLAKDGADAATSVNKAKGAYVNTGVYSKGDLVYLGGNSYEALFFMSQAGAGNKSGDDAANAKAFALPTEATTDLNWRLVAKGTNFRGAYNSASTYELGDVVSYNGTLYRCKTRIPNPAAFSAANWEVILDAIPTLAAATTPAAGTLALVNGVLKVYNTAWSSLITESNLAASLPTNIVKTGSYLPTSVDLFGTIPATVASTFAAIVLTRDTYIANTGHSGSLVEGVSTNSSVTITIGSAVASSVSLPAGTVSSLSFPVGSAPATISGVACTKVVKGTVIKLMVNASTLRTATAALAVGLKAFVAVE